MQIMIIPGPRDEQKIRQIKLNHEMLSEEDWKSFVLDCADDEKWLDALYYACDENQIGLKERAEYFHDLLIWDERKYFAYSLAKLEIDF